MDQQLTNGASQGFQNTTQSPQSSNQLNTQNVPNGSGLQPNASVNLFSSNSGISLTNLPQSTTSTTTARQSHSPKSQPHHINTGLLVVAILLFVAAAAMFWLTSRPDKKYNDL